METTRYFNIILSLIIISLLFVQHSFSQDDRNDAEIITQSYPVQMFAGNEYNIVISVKNSGSTIWTPAYYSLKQITTANSYENLWNISEVNVMSDIYPGAIETFKFSVKAPSVSGKYEFKWSMHANGMFFGKATDSEFVNVVGPYNSELSSANQEQHYNSSAYLIQVMTDTMTTGMTYQVSITMQNNGSTVWSTQAGYALGFLKSLINTDKNVLTYGNVELPRTVIPGEQVTFIFNVNAPPAPGTYSFAWIMQENNEQFGESTPLTSVTVRKAIQETLDGTIQK